MPTPPCLCATAVESLLSSCRRVLVFSCPPDFLTQKVKVVDEGEAGYDDYVKALVIHHRVLKAAMKTKQTVRARCNLQVCLRRLA